MGSTDTFTTGAAGVAPLPAAVVRPSRCDGWVAVAPAAAPARGTRLPISGGMRPATPAVRPWDRTSTGEPGIARLELVTDFAGVPAFLGGYAQRTTSTTPGAQPPRDPLS